MRLATRIRGASRLAKNVGANAIGIGWNGVLAVLVTPMYIALLGLEGYGLIGFWLVLQMVLSLSDLGLGAALIREFASADEAGPATCRRRDLLRTLEYLYWALAGVLALALLTSSGWIARHWLSTRVLSATDVANAIVWMAVALGLQFPSTLYSSGLLGLQRQGRLAAVQGIANTLRHGGGVLVLLWRAEPAYYFAAQAVCAGLQTVVTRRMVWTLLDGAGQQRPVFQGALLRSLWGFSSGMALTMVAGVLLTNVDRLFLSALQPAVELGKYTAAATAAGLLQLGIQPFYRAYFPRFAELRAIPDPDQLRREYYDGSRVVARILIPVAVVGGVFAPEILGTWLGQVDHTTVVVFRLLLVGMSCAGLTWLPAAYQQAHGWTGLHAGMIWAAVAIATPGLRWTIDRWGAPGATAAWLLHGISDVTLGLWLMHRRLLRGEFVFWWRTVIVPTLVCSAAVVGASKLAMPDGMGPWAARGWVGLTALLVGACVLCLPGKTSPAIPR